LNYGATTSIAPHRTEATSATLPKLTAAAGSPLLAFLVGDALPVGEAVDPTPVVPPASAEVMTGADESVAHASASRLRKQPPFEPQTSL